MKENKFQCDSCGGIFEKAWTDKEAEAELDKNFPNFTKDQCNLICNDCFVQLQERVDD